MARKAQFGFDSMLGYITFALFLFFTIIVLSLGGLASGHADCVEDVTVLDTEPHQDDHQH